MENFSTILKTVWRPAQKNSWGVASIPLTGRGLIHEKSFQTTNVAFKRPERTPCYGDTSARDKSEMPGMPAAAAPQINDLIVDLTLLSPIGAFGPCVTHGVLRHGAAQ